MNNKMGNRYPYLLSPLTIGNMILKNRMLSSIGSPHFFQGPETFPAESIITYYANLAKNGAAVVAFSERDEINKRTGGQPDHIRSQNYDMTDPSVQNYLSQLADDIHFYDSKISVVVQPTLPEGYVFSPKVKAKRGESELDAKFESELWGLYGKEITLEMLGEVIEQFIGKLKMYQDCGFDMVHIYIDRYLSPLTNKRTDEYGGSVENRSRFPLKLFRRIKESLGQNFLITCVARGEERSGYTLDDTIAFAKIAENVVDILEIREKDSALGHPSGFNSLPGQHETVRYAEAIKRNGTKIFVAPNGGFQNLVENEEYIASGKVDLISMVRAFICDSEYGLKAYEGRGEDVVPCIRCNKCHGIMKGPWVSYCSVNPTIGIAHKLHRLVSGPDTLKKVAIIGGGPAGMEAAILTAKRGHNVTLYEKKNYLGGQLIHGDYASFKWPIRDFKNYLISQVHKLGVEVLLNTHATPEMIKDKCYDAVLVALGAEPVIPNIPGIHGINIWSYVDVFGKEQSLGKNVIVIGGYQKGVETGMYLAEHGHKVTVITRQEQIAHDASPIHSITMAHMMLVDGGGEIIQAAWEKLVNFNYLIKTTVISISNNKVTYLDAAGTQKDIEADNVVICVGMNSKQAEAMKFSESAGRIFIIGDCDSVGNIQKSIRSAFAATSRI